MDKQQFLDYLINRQKEIEDPEVREFCETVTTIFRLVSMTEGDDTLKISFKQKLDQAKEPWEQSLQIARMMNDEDKLAIGQQKLDLYDEILKKLDV